MAEGTGVRLFPDWATANRKSCGVGSHVIRRSQLPTTFNSEEVLSDFIKKAKEGVVVDRNGIDYAVVDFGSNSRVNIHVNALAFLTKEKNPLEKKLRWHGETVGALRAFVDQLAREGVLDDVKFLNRNHVSITVPLPLATERAWPALGGVGEDEDNDDLDLS